MNDERLLRRLRDIEVPVEPEPGFAEALRQTLHAELGLDSVVSGPPRARWIRPEPRFSRRWILLAAAALLILGLVVSGLAGALMRQRVVPPAGLLDRVRETGVMRVAVRPDAPQVRVPGGTFGGFDVDVAQELERRLGFRAELEITSADDMLGPVSGNSWDIAMPSALLPIGAGTRMAATSPYYRWPVYVLVPAASTAPVIASLDSRTVCVVAGSAGEAWLIGSSGGRPGIAAPQSPPQRTTLHRMNDDEACLADIASGGSDALVTSTLSRADLSTRPGARILTDAPVFSEGRSIVALRSADPASLIDLLDTTLAAMRADGTVTTLSGRRFGGEDLSEPAP